MVLSLQINYGRSIVSSHLSQACLITIILAISGCDPTPPSMLPTNKTTSLKPAIEARIDLGVIIQGESGRISQWIRNQSDQEIRIKKLDKSCECLEATLSNQTLKPKERALLHLSYDGAKEPDFKGSLQIEVTVISNEGKPIGKIEVPVEVIPKTHQPKYAVEGSRHRLRLR